MRLLWRHLVESSRRRHLFPRLTVRPPSKGDSHLLHCATAGAMRPPWSPQASGCSRPRPVPLSSRQRLNPSPGPPLLEFSALPSSGAGTYVLAGWASWIPRGLAYACTPAWWASSLTTASTRSEGAGLCGPQAGCSQGASHCSACAQAKQGSRTARRTSGAGLRTLLSPLFTACRRPP